MKKYDIQEITSAFIRAQDKGSVALVNVLLELEIEEWYPAVDEIVWSEERNAYVLYSITKNSNDDVSPISISNTRFEPMLHLLRRIAANLEAFPDVAAKKFIETHYKSMGFPLRLHNLGEKYDT